VPEFEDIVGLSWKVRLSNFLHARAKVSRIDSNLHSPERRGRELQQPLRHRMAKLNHGPGRSVARIQTIAKRIYRTLELDGYALIDFRRSADGTPYFLEANPNPEIAESQEFAAAAKHDGIKYRDLLHRILALGMQRASGAVATG
jgi:hypothetical protein